MEQLSMENYNIVTSVETGDKKVFIGERQKGHNSKYTCGFCDKDALSFYGVVESDEYSVILHEFANKILEVL